MFLEFRNRQPCTHVLMDGGVLSVPFDRLDDFYRTCVQCINANQPIFVVEQKTEYYNFFLDIDYKNKEPLHIHEVESLATIIMTKITSLLGRYKAVVSVAKPKRKQDIIKTGIHLNFPGLVVDQYNAIQLMNHVINALNEAHPDMDWRQYIDASVYGDYAAGTRGSGFRMPWSHKKSKHTECSGLGCPACSGTGKITEGPYLPVFLVDIDGCKRLEQSPTVEMLHMTTVRSNCTTTVDVPVVVTPKRIRRIKSEGTFTTEQTKHEIHDENARDRLQSFIRKYVEGQERAYVQGIFKGKGIFYIKTNSRYCQNIGRCHNSNHIWFLLDNDGILRQKCFCTCDTTAGRKYGPCKDFSGTKHRLTTSIVNAIQSA